MTLREQQRQAQMERRRQERDRAKRILSGDVSPLAEVPIHLAEKELAYYRTTASTLSPLADGGFRRLDSGELVITNQGAYFVQGSQILRRHRFQEIERIDIPYIDVIVLITFRNTIDRDEERTYYQVNEPLVAAAHLARYTSFELILD